MTTAGGARGTDEGASMNTTAGQCSAVRHTKEPWMVGPTEGMPHADTTQIVGVHDDRGTHFILASFNHNFAELSNANAARAVACVNALAGMDPGSVAECIDIIREISETNRYDIGEAKWHRWTSKIDAALSRLAPKGGES